MKRSDFIKSTAVTVGGILLAPSLISANSSKKAKRLVILHTNDTHSNIDPFPKNHGKFPDQGGVSRRATLIKKIREENRHVLLLDAGDIFQGTPYFNKFKGELEMKVMEEMGYEFVTLGNHDFDIGMQGYLNAKKFAKFKVLNANYELKGTVLETIVQPNAIIKKGGLKIGIFGLGIDLKGLVAENNWQGLIYKDPVKVAQEQVDFLKKQKCEMIICLSHLGYDYPTDQTKISDLKLAAQTDGIDLIIGGHTHTFLEKPSLVLNKIGEKVMINQVGYGGLNLGRIDVDLSLFGKKVSPMLAQTISKDLELS